jgi:peptidoglycan/xylan/chitin deacetylase (PgdA/CDA1 family)
VLFAAPRLQGGATTQAPVAARAMALTFDDLPYVDVGAHQLSKAQRVTDKILDVLARHQAPAVGFVNEGKVHAGGETDARIALLQQWVDRGHVLGNHTYSHADLNATTVRGYETDITKGAVVVNRLMSPHQPSPMFFRHPYTHAGDTAAKKEAIERYLDAQGYRIAPHTIDSSDYIFNVPYARASDNHESAMATRLGTTYVDFVMDATTFAERIGPKVVGHELPQTILLHANDINADYLEVLLTRFVRHGYRFVTLDAAMADPAYHTKDTLVTTSGPTWLWRWMKSQGLAVSFREDPEPPAWVTALYNGSLTSLRLDHTPIAVRDLPAAIDQFHALGFTIKPGRPHQNGIENASIKFADGSYLELITSHDASDAVSREYQQFLRD